MTPAWIWLTSCEGHDAHGQDEKQRADEREEQILHAVDAFQKDITVGRLRHEREAETGGRSDDEHGEHVA